MRQSSGGTTPSAVPTAAQVVEVTATVVPSASPTAALDPSSAATATPVQPTATALPATPNATRATKTPRWVGEIRPNELGKIMLLEYHVIGDEELRWTRTRANFRRDLEYLYRNGYYLVGVHDLLDNRLDVPIGKTPVVLTFDDSNRSQFQFAIGRAGCLSVDPRSGLGILEEFVDAHPDFGRAAIFCVLPAADPPNDLFGQPEYRAEKLRYLVRRGYELCNHTQWHARLDKLNERDGVRQIALGLKAIQDAVPNYRVRVFNPPGGMYSKSLALMQAGAYDGTAYRHEAILEVTGGPMPAPNHVKADFLHVPRIQAIQSELDRWFGHFERFPEERYVSDGDPNRIVYPRALESTLRRPPGAADEPSPLPDFGVLRLR